MSAGQTARERVRAELVREITEIARRQLATDGAAGLSLRAVAREMGMVSSAIYRYFPSRDDLLTALIIDGYNAVGEAVERADARARAGAGGAGHHGGRWLAVCRAVRDWALAHPHEYALLYGSPVPGYKAPDDTVAAALRDTLVMARIVSEAHAAGALDPAGPCPPPPPAIADDMARARAMLPMDVPDDVMARAFTAWAALYGTVSFELFGQYNNVIEERTAYFDYTMTLMARLVGLRP
ncbi:AcrR family transcriptional regulator [Actinomadura coerulea]|uniref:AcrR family transcriptional regulator n=1 Tax=Actinomadura coerulea TaxID=46159 RepID=A0A7X0G1H6_9ACTN|nr:TetR/AcrR family transcriptional regulator [Actinomadura coerulea]MBB6397704.1 AcrR family transcriptional regulator [Actinomadura coerulea]GGQ17924.1 TetR family transcriptional regulator [Actinomadura coerulea]